MQLHILVRIIGIIFIIVIIAYALWELRASNQPDSPVSLHVAPEEQRII